MGNFLSNNDIIDKKNTDISFDYRGRDDGLGIRGKGVEMRNYGLWVRGAGGEMSCAGGGVRDEGRGMREVG